MITLFGIKNCDTVKKARRWLEANDTDYCFHDFRTDGISADQVSQWLNDVGADTLINKRSTTWKALDDDQRQLLFPDDNKIGQSAIELILDQPTLIKRPVLSVDKTIYIGFKDATYESIFN